MRKLENFETYEEMKNFHEFYYNIRKFYFSVHLIFQLEK